MEGKILDKNKSEFGAYEASLATFLFVVLNFVFMESFYAYARTFGVSSIGILIAQFLVEALFGVAAWLAAIFCKKSIVMAAGLNKKISVTMVIYAVLIAFCSLIFFASLTSSFLEFLGLIGYKSSASSMAVNDFGSYIGYVIAACITPAVCEELLFRGTIQSGLKKYGKWVSIVSASLIFMLMHGGPEQTVHQFIVGVIVGLIFYETGNLWLSIIVHFFNNFISITELFAYNMLIGNSAENLETPSEVAEITAVQAWTSFAINLFIALIMATIGYLLVRFLIKKLVEEDKKVNGVSASASLQSGEAQTILVDGKEIETNVTISQTEQSDETLAEKQPEIKPQEKKPMDTKTILLFALPIAWMVINWFLAFVSGFLG